MLFIKNQHEKSWRKEIEGLQCSKSIGSTFLQILCVIFGVQTVFCVCVLSCMGDFARINSVRILRIIVRLPTTQMVQLILLLEIVQLISLQLTSFLAEFARENGYIFVFFLVHFLCTSMGGEGGMLEAEEMQSSFACDSALIVRAKAQA